MGVQGCPRRKHLFSIPSDQIITTRDWQQIGPNPLQRFRSDPSNTLQFLVVQEEALGLARFDNPLGERLADAGQLNEFRPVGLVQINLEFGRLRP